MREVKGKRETIEKRHLFLDKPLDMKPSNRTGYTHIEIKKATRPIQTRNEAIILNITFDSGDRSKAEVCTKRVFPGKRK